MEAPTREPTDFIHDARKAIESERDASSEEIDALVEFRERVDKITSEPVSSAKISDQTRMVGTPVATPIAVPTVDDDLRSQLRTSYRETIMTVSTASELEDDIRDHMAAELGPDAANAVFARSGPPPDATGLLRGRIEGAIESRHQILRQCQAETDALETFSVPIQAIHDERGKMQSRLPLVSFDDLVAYNDLVDDIATACERIARRRQDYLQTEFEPDPQFHEFTSYVYRNYDFRFPVLSAIVKIVTGLRKLRREITHEIACR